MMWYGNALGQKYCTLMEVMLYCNQGGDEMNKKWIITLVSLVGIIIVAFSVIAFNFKQYDTGLVTGISVDTRNKTEMELKIIYFLAMGGYSVRSVAEDEGEYCGDGIKDYDGSIGKYRILIEFGDVEPHTLLVKRLTDEDGLKLGNGNVQLKSKIAYHSDHGFVLYIGSDQPVYVEDIEGNDLNGLCGVIRIPFFTDERE